MEIGQCGPTLAIVQFRVVMEPCKEIEPALILLHNLVAMSVQ